MRVRIAAVAALLVLAGVASPAAAAPQGWITLHGTTSAWAMIDVPGDVTIDAWGMKATGAGRFGGFYVDFRDRPFNLGTIWLRDFHMPGDSGGHVGALGLGSNKLTRGRYRIYLVADGPMTVRIPVTGMTSRTLRPTTRTTAALSIEELGHRGVNDMGVFGRQPVVAAKRSVSFSGILLDDQMVFAGTLATCLTEPGGTCDSGGWDNGKIGWFVNPYGAYPFGWSTIYSPGVKAGRLDAVQSAENVFGIPYALGTSFTLALV